MTDRDSPRPRQNHLLNALPTAEYEGLFPHMEEVPMPLGKVLYESGDELHHAYFREHAKPGEAIKQPFWVFHHSPPEIRDASLEMFVPIRRWGGGTTTIPSFSGHKVTDLAICSVEGVKWTNSTWFHKIKKSYNETQLDLQVWYLDFVYEFLGTENSHKSAKS